MNSNRFARRNMRFLSVVAVAGFALCLPTVTAYARPIVASDNASDAVYNDGWQTGDDGGFGFGAWTLSTSGGNAGFFIGSSNGNGSNNGPGIDTGGESFGLYANSNDNPSALASRPIDSPLVVGSTLSFGYDNGFVDGGVAAQFRLADSTGTARLTFQFVGGGNNYSVIDAGGTQNFGNGNGPNDLGGFSSAGLTGIFTLTGTDTYSLQMTRLESGQTATISGTLAGTVGSGIGTLQAFTNARGGGGTGDFFVNNFEINTPAAVVPEPGTLALLMFGGVGVVGACITRRKKNG